MENVSINTCYTLSCIGLAAKTWQFKTVRVWRTKLIISYNPQVKQLMLRSIFAWKLALTTFLVGFSIPHKSEVAYNSETRTLSTTPSFRFLQKMPDSTMSKHVRLRNTSSIWIQDVRSCAIIILLMNNPRVAIDQFPWKYNIELECGPMPNVMAALPNIGGALCSTPQSLADAHYSSAVQ